MNLFVFIATGVLMMAPVVYAEVNDCTLTVDEMNQAAHDRVLVMYCPDPK